MHLSREVARRYLLGRQGLWPGRRWSGKDGAAAAIRQIGAVQIDPLNVVGRNHDLVLWSRVVDYQPVYLDALLYTDRAFFDYGGLLFIYPIEELPYWRLHMRRRGENAARAAWAHEHAALLDEVRAELRARGPIGNRDFAGNVRVTNYRARKDTGLALWHMWITGELMTHSRRGFERLYGFREQIVPPAAHEPSDEEAEQFFARKALSGPGLTTAGGFGSTLSYLTGRRIERAESRRWLERLEASGETTTARVEGVKDTFYQPAAELPLLAALDRGAVPDAWRPLETTTEEEVTILAPLDNLLHRQRTKAIFDFDYIWEVYKPAAQRRWGYYTVPILYGDRLVARLDPKVDRRSDTLILNGFWLKDEALADDPAFLAGLTRGLTRFLRYQRVQRVDATAVAFPGVRTASEAVGAALEGT